MDDQTIVTFECDRKQCRIAKRILKSEKTMMMRRKVTR